MVIKLIDELEDLEDNTLEENIRLCGQLEAALQRRNRFQRAARGVHLLLFSVTALMVLTFFRWGVLADCGRLEKVPEKFRAFVMQGVISDTLPESYKKLLIPVVVLLCLPVAADVLFSIRSRTPSEGLPESAEKALKSTSVDKKLKFLDKSLDRSIAMLGPGGSFLDSTQPANWLCIAFTLLYLYNVSPIILGGQDAQRITVYTVFAVVWFLLCQAAYRIPSKATGILFSVARGLTRLYQIKHSLPAYTTDVKADFQAKEEEARLAAMTPEQRRWHEWMQEKEKQQREREEQERREQARKEEEELEQWMASKRCVCRFYSAGVCNYYSTADYTTHCDYYSNPGQCSACLMNKGLMFVDK